MSRYPRECSDCGKVHLPHAFVPVCVVTLVAALLLAVAMSDRIAAAIGDRDDRLRAASVRQDAPILINAADGPLSVLSAVATPSGTPAAVPLVGASSGQAAIGGATPPAPTVAAVSTTTLRPAAATSTTRPTAQSTTVSVATTASATTTTTPTSPATSTLTTTTTTRPTPLGGLIDLCVLSGLGLPWCN